MLQAQCAGASALSVGAMSGLACRIEGFSAFSVAGGWGVCSDTAFLKGSKVTPQPVQSIVSVADSFLVLGLGKYWLHVYLEPFGKSWFSGRVRTWFRLWVETC